MDVQLTDRLDLAGHLKPSKWPNSVSIIIASDFKTTSEHSNLAGSNDWLVINIIIKNTDRLPKCLARFENADRGKIFKKSYHLKNNFLSIDRGLCVGLTHGREHSGSLDQLCSSNVPTICELFVNRLLIGGSVVSSSRSPNLKPQTVQTAPKRILVCFGFLDCRKRVENGQYAVSAPVVNFRTSRLHVTIFVFVLYVIQSIRRVFSQWVQTRHNII